MTKLVKSSPQVDHASSNSPVSVSATTIETRVAQRGAGRRKRKWLLRGLTVGIALLASLLLAEVGLRLCVVQEGKRLATYDEVLGWRGRPHGEGFYVRKADSIHIPFQYNELGFRDRSVPLKPAGSKRLMLLGDSFVESLEVDFSETFGAQLEEALQPLDSDWDVCVIGSQGYSTAQELLAFRKFQPLVEADLVLLCFYCGNDFEDNQRHRFAFLDQDQALVLPSSSDPDWKHALQHFQRWLYESSHVVYLLKNSLESLSNIQLAPESKSTVAQSEEYQRNITQQLIQHLQRDVTEAGGQLGVVIIPSRDDLLADKSQKVDFVIQVCENQKIACIDLSRQLTPEHFFGVDLHFNAQGHRIAAAAIASFLADGRLPSKDVARLSSGSKQVSLSD